MPDWTDNTLLGNSLRDWIFAAGTATLAMAAIVLLRAIVVRSLSARAARSATVVDDLLAGFARSIRKTYVAVIAFCLAGLWLDFGYRTHAALRDVAVVFAVLQTGRAASQLITLVLDRYSKSHGELDRTTITALGIAAKSIAWIALLLIAIDTLGFKISGWLTGLGVGGVVIALSLQNIFSDLFAALSIVLDKPFIVGDTIAVDDFEGSVEHIGLKSTRVTSINGEQVVFANTDLLKSRVRNLSRRVGRRLVFTISVDAATKAAQLARVPAIMAEVVGAEPRAALRRSHLIGVGARGFDIETAVHIPHPEYNLALDVRQAILLEFYARMEREGISIARPSGYVPAHEQP